MDLIDYYNTPRMETPTPQQLNRVIREHFPPETQSNIKFIDSLRNTADLISVALVYRHNTVDVYARIRISLQNLMLHITIFFMKGVEVIRLRQRNHRLAFLREALKFNSEERDFLLKIDPRSGSLALSKTIKLPNQSEALPMLISQICSQCFDKIGTHTAVVDKLLRDLFSSESSLSENSEILRLIKCIQVSDKYSWLGINRETPLEDNPPPKTEDKNIFAGSKGKCFKCLDCYPIKMHQFRKNPPKIKQPKYPKVMEVFQCQAPRKFDEFALFSARQDDSLAKVLKLKSAQDNKKQILVEITSSDVINTIKSRLDSNKKKQEIQIMLHTEGPISLYLERLEGIQKQRYNTHELELVRQMATKESIYLGRYFKIADPAIAGEYKITNMAKYKLFEDVIASNRQTMSLSTRLHLLGNVVGGLVYLRNHNVMLMNLNPKSIRVRRNHQVWLSDLSRSYHSELPFKPKRQKLPENPKSKLELLYETWPYILPPICSQRVTTNSPAYPFEPNFQKYDVYCFGNLMYQTIFGKSPLRLQGSRMLQTVSKMPFNRETFDPELKPYVAKKLVIGFDKFQDYGQHIPLRLLGLFSLKCLDIYYMAGPPTSPTDIPDTFKRLPYLDWLLIIFNEFTRILVKH